MMRGRGGGEDRGDKLNGEANKKTIECVVKPTVVII